MRRDKTKTPEKRTTMAATAPLDPYITLGLRRDADMEAIRRAYRTLSAALKQRRKRAKQEEL